MHSKFILAPLFIFCGAVHSPAFLQSVHDTQQEISFYRRKIEEAQRSNLGGVASALEDYVEVLKRAAEEMKGKKLPESLELQLSALEHYIKYAKKTSLDDFLEYLQLIDEICAKQME